VTLSKVKNDLIKKQEKLEVMMEVLMGKMYKLSIEIISRHDVHSRKGNEVKRSTK